MIKEIIPIQRHLTLLIPPIIAQLKVHQPGKLFTDPVENRLPRAGEAIQPILRHEPECVARETVPVVFADLPVLCVGVGVVADEGGDVALVHVEGGEGCLGEDPVEVVVVGDYKLPKG